MVTNYARYLRDAHAWSPPCRESDEERVALVFGYVGDGYHGLQRNDVEDALATVEVTGRRSNLESTDL